MSDNFLDNIKKYLVRHTSLDIRVPAGREVVNSRDVYRLVQSYEQLENTERAMARKNYGMCYLNDHLQSGDTADSLQPTRSAGTDSDLILLTISHTLASKYWRIRLTRNARLRKGNYDAIDY